MISPPTDGRRVERYWQADFVVQATAKNVVQRGPGERDAIAADFVIAALNNHGIDGVISDTIGRGITRRAGGEKQGDIRLAKLRSATGRPVAGIAPGEVDRAAPGV